MKLNIFNSVDELNEALAKHVLRIGNAAIASKGRFDFVLTGGSSPKELYKILSSTYKGDLDWSKVFFFIGDERYVPKDDKDYNGLMAKTFLLDGLSIPDSQVFLVDTSLPPEEAARAYKKALDEHFVNGPLIFDLILLGMGDDAHTASIFPHTALVTNQEENVAAVWVEKLNTFRISFTAPLINNAKHIVFLAYGENKAEAMRHVLGDETKDFASYPAQLIEPKNGELAWFTDGPATRSLKS